MAGSTSIVSEAGTVELAGRLAQSILALVRHSDLVQQFEHGRIELHFSPTHVVFQLVPTIRIDVPEEFRAANIRPEFQVRKK